MWRSSLIRALWRGTQRRSRRSLLPAVSCELESLEPRQVLSSVSLNQSGAAAVHTNGPVARIINGTATAAYPAVGRVGGDGQDFGSGVLIAPQFVLTAGHVADGVADTAGQFTVGGVTYHTDKVFLHPHYNSNELGNDAANDIAIYRLSEPVLGIAPLPISRAVPRVGLQLTLVGFGGGGTGLSGGDGGYGTERVGTTPIDQVTSKLIRWNFDNNTESNTAPGDSGGPAFVTVGGVKYIAGITSGGDSTTSAIGDHSFDTRVDAYAAWIDAILRSPPPLPMIGITVTDASAAETSSDQMPNTGTFELTRSGSTSAALTVMLAIKGTATNGSDDVSLPTTVRFSPGQAVTTLTVTPVDDSIKELNETVTVMLMNSPRYSADSTRSTATVTIGDNDRVLPIVSLIASDASAAETRSGQAVNRGQFTISRTGPTSTALTVSVAVSGTATNGVDDTRLGTTATIPAGRASVIVNVIPIDDHAIESPESVILTLNGGAAYNVDEADTSATVTIADNDAVHIANDNFAGRKLITSSNVTTIGNSRGATSEAGEPNPGGTSGGTSLWWSWTAPSTGSVTMSTAGSNFDTTLGVYTGSTLASLQTVRENDDQNFAGGVLTSKLTFTAIAGTTYHILINGYHGESGDIKLAITLTVLPKT